MDLITEETFKGAKLSDVVASAQYELGTRKTSYPTALALVRELGRRIRQSLYEESGEPKVLAPEEEAVWRAAFDAAFPEVEVGVDRGALLVAVKNDMAALEGYRVNEIASERIDQLMHFMTPFCDGLRKAEGKAKAATGWENER